ncbi:MAG: biosynthetic arginine decarboxylase [Deltaproteobacteria bacterium]|nr:biosynthetic arginine decarboxylase [Deltaproteobacteria bacterium]
MSWSLDDSEELYNIPAWGLGYFRVNEEGHLEMTAGEGRSIDLFNLVGDLKRRGIALPVLVRFSDILQGRIDGLVKAFEDAFTEYDYHGKFRGVYPIKVNQERHFVQALVAAARPHHIGLEAGSKPELLVSLAHMDDPEAIIVCNGYKDRQYIEMAILARKIGRRVILVVEKPYELDLILEVSEQLGIDPLVGVRARLSLAGAGKWAGSSGDRAKFGLTIQEIVDMVHKMERAGKLSALTLLHYHIGSQVSAIRAIKNALREASRIYTELVRLGAPMGYIDVGGGLGVDYDGSRTDFHSSMNYSAEEYAYDVVYAIKEACDAAKVPHPNVVTESGRALSAHNSVLLFDVLGMGSLASSSERLEPSGSRSELVKELEKIWESVGEDDLQGAYHDAVEIKDETLTRFKLGLVGIEERAVVERLFWAVCRKVADFAKQLEFVPEDLEPVFRSLADTYYCNFSLFQSAPDSWAIGQLFPVLPIHRLDEEPTRRGVLADITCDSDGKVDQFIGARGTKDVLELHTPDGQPYILGMFLLGAYQEILGDLHNLFGDPNTIHVTAVPGGRGYRIDHVVEGDVVQEVLSYVQYDRRQLLECLRKDIEAATDRGHLSIEEGALFWDTYLRGLDSYTYLKV